MILANSRATPLLDAGGPGVNGGDLASRNRGVDCESRGSRRRASVREQSGARHRRRPGGYLARRQDGIHAVRKGLGELVQLPEVLRNGLVLNLEYASELPLRGLRRNVHSGLIEHLDASDGVGLSRR